MKKNLQEERKAPSGMDRWGFFVGMGLIRKTGIVSRRVSGRVLFEIVSYFMVSSFMIPG
jgi:hypothetical protein